MASKTFTVQLMFDYTVVDEYELRAEGRRIGLKDSLPLGQLLGELAQERSKAIRAAALIPGTRVPAPMFQTPTNLGWSRYSTGHPNDPEVTG